MTDITDRQQALLELTDGLVELAEEASEIENTYADAARRLYELAAHIKWGEEATLEEALYELEDGTLPVDLEPHLHRLITDFDASQS